MPPPISINPIGRTAEELVASAQRLENLGYPAVWLNENRFDAYATAAAVAATTRRITVGTAVAVWSRSPVQASLAAATITQLAGGRFVHGVGSGPAERNERWHGIPYRKAGQRLREYLTCLRLAWQATPLTPASFAGEFYRIDRYVRLDDQPPAPIRTYVGVVRPLACRIAGELADGVLLDTNLSVAYIRGVVLPALAQGAARAGRPLADYLVSAGQLVCVDRDHPQAVEWARHRLVSHIVHDYYRQLYAYGGFAAEAEAASLAIQRGDTRAALDAISEEMVLAHACAGTPDEVRRQISRWEPFVNDIRIALPIGTLTHEEIAANWRQIIDTFPPR
ncbi:MAG: LLM class F420-dependent oxidoreductase [Dehalococcoidia bacterium]|nr:MAG: LLM class F420-dependent oxidoreductase [Dehalococcoidia bacterium]